MNETPPFSLTPIGVVASDYRDKFGVPRQPGLVEAARGIVSLLDPYDDPLAVEGLTAYSHLWLSFVFDRSPPTWRARVRPPRLGGNRRVGVFATRSTHRPNRLGLSVVRLLDVATTVRPGPPPWPQPGAGAAQSARTHLLIGGHDLVSGTPIVDIKPYLPWADACADARAELAPAAPGLLAVRWRPEAAQALASRTDGESLKALIEQVLAQDPRPAYRQDDADRVYGVALRDVDVRFKVDAREAPGVVEIREIVAGQPPI
ncbi:tRNA (N6-threonylcarbamoyladenosine(37)-N6)-methyltransferase TrmO [Salinisphaera hydrothermalis]|uniref:tRNA (N6-threonylcarbamoyladenosine(37)-N6)-methyltransferase TrmO n=1 Tax=Salinisphaera hydrothermalis TaxID=563188 RepID=UPI003342CA08